MKSRHKSIPLLGACSLSLALLVAPVGMALADDQTDAENFCGPAAEILRATKKLPASLSIKCIWQETGKVIPDAPDVHVLNLYHDDGARFENLGSIAVSKDGKEWWSYDVVEDSYSPIPQADLPKADTSKADAPKTDAPAKK